MNEDTEVKIMCYRSMVSEQKRHRNREEKICLFNTRAIFAFYLYFSTTNDLEGSKQTLPLIISVGLVSQVTSLADIRPP